MTKNNLNSLWMPAVPPQRGEAALFIALDCLEYHTMDEAIQKAIELGHKPELRYRQTESGLFLFLLLKYEQFAGVPPKDLWLDEWSKLIEAFKDDDMAIRCPRSTQPGVREAVAA
ncbi:MAG: hypothetical protein OHK0037_20440 [Elainellaceae cyanobacterium]